MQTDGKVLVGGHFFHAEYDEFGTPVGYAFIPFIYRCNTNGSGDDSFTPASLPDFTQMESIAVQGDGKVLIGGRIGTTGILRLSANGSLDSSFNPGTGFGDSGYPVNSIAVQANGKILIGGDFTTFDGTNRNGIARLNADGSLDTSFNPGTGARGRFAGSSGVTSVALQPDGKVLIGGHFITINGINRNRIARLNADGSLDDSFNPGTGANEGVLSIALQPDGNILIGGSFTSVNGVVRPRIARLYGDSVAPLLSISRSSATLILSWPVNRLNFQLQENTNLVLPNGWSTVAQPAITNAGQIAVTVPAGLGPKFFRLMSP